MTTSSAADSLPDGTRVGRTALRVADLDEVSEFYQRVVGLAELRRDGTTATLGVDGTPLLELAADDTAPARHSSAAGLYHNAFRVPSRAALGDALSRVRERWHLGGATDHRVSEALYLTDPEGNGVEIYRDYPREEWPVTDDGRVQMANDRLDIDGLAAAAAGESSAPAGTDVGHVHLEVSSLDAFESFYVDAVGFDVQAEVPRATFAGAGGYHHHLAGNTWHGRTTAAEGRGLAWFEICLPDADALEALRARLRDCEVAITETDEGFSASDPDDIEVRFRIDA